MKARKTMQIATDKDSDVTRRRIVTYLVKGLVMTESESNAYLQRGKD